MIVTGVAYCNVASGDETVRNIKKWPAKREANHDKVCISSRA